MALSFTLERITPAMAEEWLATGARNRKFHHLTTLKAWAGIMKAGEWNATHQGIAFNVEGKLIDGQNRLKAIILAGVPVEMIVARGVPGSSMLYIDSGKPRTDADAITIDGYDVGKQTLAVAKMLWNAYMEQEWSYRWGSPLGLHLSRDDLKQFVMFHAEAIAFTNPEHRLPRGLGSAPVRAAIASAWWSADRDRLSTFQVQLRSGLVDDQGDTAVIRLRDWVMQSPLLGGGRDARQEMYMKTSSAIRAYLDYRPLTKLYCRRDAAFHLPVIDGIRCVGRHG